MNIFGNSCNFGMLNVMELVRYHYNVGLVI